MHPAHSRALAAEAPRPLFWRVMIPATPFILAALAWLVLSRTASAEVHVVAPGETLSVIAAEYGTTVDAIAQANAIENPDFVVAGATLHIPGAGEAASTNAVQPDSLYTVQPGDWLSSIAEQFGLSVAALAQLNGITDPDMIYAGQQLLVPAGPGRAHMLHADVEPLLQAAADEFGLPRNLLEALAWQESGWQQWMVSASGAIGVMQVLPDTADWAIGSLIDGPLDWQNDALANARLGAAILRHYLTLTDGDVTLAIGAYYQGWDALQQNGLYDGTRDYVNNVLALENQFE